MEPLSPLSQRVPTQPASPPRVSASSAPRRWRRVSERRATGPAAADTLWRGGHGTGPRAGCLTLVTSPFPSALSALFIVPRARPVMLPHIHAPLALPGPGEFRRGKFRVCRRCADHFHMRRLFSVLFETARGVRRNPSQRKGERIDGRWSCGIRSRLRLCSRWDFCILAEKTEVAPHP